MVNLHLEDVPLLYQPPIGPQVSFQLSYRQRGSEDEDQTIFGVGTNWSCSFRAFVFAPSGFSFVAYLHRAGAGWMTYPSGYSQEWDGSLLTPAGPGCQVEHPDGSVDTYGTNFTDLAGKTLYFLTAHSDSAGNQTTFTYSNTAAGLFLLNSVTDANGGVTRLYYDNSAYPNLITSVVDPFSRTNLLSYDAQGFLANIVDVQGLSSSFTYDTDPSGLYRGWITNLATPYGNTAFAFGGSDATNDTMMSAGVNRYAKVTLPTGGEYIYLYRTNSGNLLGSWSPPVPTEMKDPLMDDPFIDIP